MIHLRPVTSQQYKTIQVKIVIATGYGESGRVDH